MIRKFWHVGLSVENLDKAIAEYKKLGFNVAQKFEKPEPKAHAAHLTHPNGSGIEMWEWIDHDHPQVEFIKNHIAFQSDNIDKDIESLVAQGWEVVIPKTVGVTVTYSFVRDPSGDYIEIAEVKE